MKLQVLNESIMSENLRGFGERMGGWGEKRRLCGLMGGEEW